MELLFNMDLKFENLLLEWPLPIIKDVDIIAVILNAAKRYVTVNRALKKGILVRLRRGFT